MTVFYQIRRICQCQNPTKFELGGVLNGSVRSRIAVLHNICNKIIHTLDGRGPCLLVNITTLYDLFNRDHSVPKLMQLQQKILQLFFNRVFKWPLDQPLRALISSITNLYQIRPYFIIRFL